MKRYLYLEPAANELRNAAIYYRQRSPRVAARFMAAVQHALDQVLEFPESAPRVRGEVRGRVVERFPYTLMYRIDENLIVFLAVAHHKQRPEFWVERTR